MRQKLLLVDGFNCFIRNFSMLTLSANDGRHLGGVMGFLGSLRHAIERNKPDRVIIAWDEGHSIKREAIYADYKIERQRKPRKVLMPFQTLAEQDESFNYQVSRLRTYLDLLPVATLSCGNTEADDIIAHFCTHENWTDWDKVIYSTDKDFLQLVKEDVVIYHPMKKKIIDTKSVLEQYHVHPRNFAVFKSIIGDASDSILGIEGLGFKSAIRWLPIFLLEEKEITLEDVFTYCKEEVEAIKKPLKAHASILDGRAKIEANFKITRLDEPMLSLSCMDKLARFKESPQFGKFEKLKLRMLFIQDDAQSLLENMSNWSTGFLTLQRKLM